MENLDRFAELFVGGDQAHGLWDERRGAKTERGPATPERYAEHLAGKLGLGLVPVRRDGTCRFAAIDIDIDSIDHVALLAKVLARKLPLTVFRSKSGGAHATLFMKEPGLPAATVIQTLRRWATLLGYPAAEIFPKQTKITKRDCGNWINLPYFGDARTSRYAVGEQGALTLEEFLTSFEYYDPATCQADEAKPEPKAKPEPEPAEPIAASGGDGKIPEGKRSEKLISIAGTLRNRNLDQDAIEAALQAHNRTHCVPPLPEREVAAIAASAARYRPVERYHLTDVGNAERFIDRHEEDVRYDHKRRQWFCWDGRRFLADARGRVERLARATARAIFGEAANAEDASRRDKLFSWAKRSEFERSLRAMLWVARTWEGVAVLPDEFDRDPMLLNCRNGTLNLRTSELREHRRADLISKMVATDYDPAAKCPRFDEFLEQIMR
ncbi:MAG: primase C-terminal domain-containing protein, partial [Gemmatimonadota bacterium]